MLSILIVNWNTRDYLRACLASLAPVCANIPHEIIVVDNASADGSAKMVSTLFPQVRLIASETNLGYAAGNNLAYEYSSGKWIWLLNPDTEVLGDAPERMIAFLQSTPRCGAVASALIDASTRKPQRSCRTFPTPPALWVEALGLAKRYPRSRRFGFYRMGWWNYDDSRRVAQPMASSLMLRRSATDEISNPAIGGLFDTAFPIYFNDVDLSWRLGKRGWESWYLHEAEVLHYGGASTGQIKPAMIAESHRSLRRFYDKHYRSLVPPLVYFATIVLIQVGCAMRICGLAVKNGIKRTISSL